MTVRDVPKVQISDLTLMTLSRAIGREMRFIAIKGAVGLGQEMKAVCADSIVLMHWPIDDTLAGHVPRTELIYIGVKDLRDPERDGLRCLRALPRLPVGLRRQMFFNVGRKGRLDWRFGMSIAPARGMLKSIEVFSEDLEIEEGEAVVQAERRIVFSFEKRDDNEHDLALENRFCGFGKLFLTASSRRPDNEPMSALHSRVTLTQPYSIH